MSTTTPSASALHPSSFATVSSSSSRTSAVATCPKAPSSKSLRTKTKKSAKDVDESTDTYDTIEWLLHNVPNNNGKAGIWGISYDGFYAAAGIIDSHPALKAASPQAPVSDLFMGDDAYHNGAFMLAANFGFYTFFPPRTAIGPPPAHGPRYDYGTTDGYEFYLQMGPLSNSKKLLNQKDKLLGRSGRSRQLRRLLESPRHLHHLKNVIAPSWPSAAGSTPKISSARAASSTTSPN